MKKIKLFLFALTLFSFSFPVMAAFLQSLSNNQVIQAFQDKTITIVPLVTHNGRLIDNFIFAYFSKQNQITGKFATPVDSEPQTDQGTWSVDGKGMLCVTWQHWFSQKPICVNVYSFENSLIFVNPKGNKIQMMAFRINDEPGNKVEELSE